MKAISNKLAGALAVALAAPAAAQYTISSPGGLIPSTGTGGGGNGCTLLPTSSNTFPMSAPIPPCATSITSITLVGLTHTWTGDLQVVLFDPLGNGYNLLVRLGGTTCTSSGFSVNLGGDYSFVAAADPAITSAWPAVNPGTSAILPSGTYPQNYNMWTSGSAMVSNTDIASIPVVPGVWSLAIFDGAGGDVGALTSWCIDGETSAGNLDCGPGGAINDASVAGPTGAWPTMLPTDFTAFPLATPVSACATRIESVLIAGLTHSWSGDCHILLEDPSGDRYNLLVRPGVNSATSFGHSADFGGNYQIVDPSSPTITQAWPVVNPGGAAVYPSGVYAQEYGTLWGSGWLNGADGVQNVDLSSIPVEPGIWTLYIYDAASPDTGTVAGWCLNTSNERGPSYCMGNVNSTGMPANFTYSGSDSIAANDLTLNVSDLPQNSFGFFIVGSACGFVPAAGGGMGDVCVGGTIRRALGNVVANSGSSGMVSVLADLHHLPAPGFPVPPGGVMGYAGQRLYVQYWYRDLVGGVLTSNLSNARFFILRN